MFLPVPQCRKIWVKYLEFRRVNCLEPNFSTISEKYLRCFSSFPKLICELFGNFFNGVFVSLYYIVDWITVRTLSADMQMTITACLSIYVYYIQHCLTCRLSDTVSEDDAWVWTRDCCNVTSSKILNTVTIQITTVVHTK